MCAYNVGPCGCFTTTPLVEIYKLVTFTYIQNFVTMSVWHFLSVPCYMNSWFFHNEFLSDILVWQLFINFPLETEHFFKINSIFWSYIDDEYSKNCKKLHWSRLMY